MRPAFPSLTAGLLLIALGAGPSASQEATGTFNRCVDAEGRAVFTDRPCEAVDARPAHRASADPEAPNDARAVPDCARTPAALVLAIEAALSAADGNRLAAFYDWRGRSNAAANAVMPRLEAIAASRLIEARTAHSAEGRQDPDLAAEAAKAPPDRLRIVHAPDGLGTGETAEFRLVRAAGCWWIAD